MPATSGFTANDIARAMASKAEDAFGVPVTEPFAVKDIEQHRADVVYTVKASYSSTYVSRPVSYATGPMFYPQQLQEVFNQRQRELFAEPGLLRKLTEQQLLGNANLYREPTKLFLMSDSQVCCTLENCQGCAGDGTVNCHRCNGTARIQCSRCHGARKVHCMGCSGTGRTAHTRFCSYCGGAGSRGGHSCSACNGSGLAGQPCYQCASTGSANCYTCHGSGDETCNNCRRGQVTCGTCNGACQLIYEYHLDIFVDTSVSYRWSNLTASWMNESLTEIMKTPQRHSVFRVERTQATDEANVFAATGHVAAAQATVTYQSISGSCRFIGPSLTPVHLDGVLSGEFKKAVEGVKDFQDIKKVDAASSSKIARELIKETDDGVSVARSSPVRRGIISADDAESFLSSRYKAFDYVESTCRDFRWKAVLGMSFPLFKVLVCLYAIMGILTRGVPKPLQGNEGLLGLFKVGKWFQWEAHPISWMLYRANNYHDYWQLGCWVLAGMMFNRFILWLIAPRLWDWASGSWGRLILISVPGMVLLDLFMTLHPSAFVDLRFIALIPNIQMNASHILSQVIAFVILYVPQIYILAFVTSLVLYKAAGVHWGVRMLQVLQPGLSIHSYWGMLKRK